MKKIIILLLICLWGFPLVSADSYDDYNQFWLDNLGANDPLVFEYFGQDLLPPTDYWEFVSQNSASIGFSTNLPARTYIEYGTTSAYGQQTLPSDRYYFHQVLRLKNLNSGTTYHYRIVAQDQRGNIVYGMPRTITPQTIAGAKRIPQDVSAGPPYIISSPGYYLLTQDIDADGTGIEIRTNGVTIDLNGHTITYNNVNKNINGGWDTYLTQAHFGIAIRYSDNINIHNGIIQQGIAQSNGDADLAFGFNPIMGDSSGDVEISGVELIYGGSQVLGLLLQWVNPAEVHHNIFTDRGFEVLNRHGQGVPAMYTAQNNNIHSYNNLVRRTRQGGLKGDVIHDNEIHLDSFATNSYGTSWDSNLEVYNNKIYGTGYHAVAIPWGANNDYHNNFIQMHGQGPKGRGYDYGLEEALIGFRQTAYGTGTEVLPNNHIYDNLIIITGGGCTPDGECTIARGIQHHSGINIPNNIIENNMIKVDVNEGVTTAGAVVTNSYLGSCDSVQNVLYRNNKLISNYANVLMGDDYAPGCGHLFIDNEFIKIGTNPEYATFKYINYFDVRNIFNFGGIYSGGASNNNVDFSSPGQEYEYGFTGTLKVFDGNQPAVGAQVIIKNKNGVTIVSGITDANGVLSEQIIYYTLTPSGQTSYAPFDISIWYDEDVKNLVVSDEFDWNYEVRFNDFCGANGIQRSCGTDVGECALGVQTCNDGSWSACIGGVVPSSEICDNKDNDCDGSTDEFLGDITCGEGICTNTVPSCINGMAQTCNPFLGQIFESGTELCINGIDDNCLGDGDDLCQGIVSQDTIANSITCTINDALGIATIYLVDDTQNVIDTNKIVNNNYYFIEAEAFEYNPLHWGVCPDNRATIQGNNCEDNIALDEEMASSLAITMSNEGNGGITPMTKTIEVLEGNYNIWARSFHGGTERAWQIRINGELFSELLGDEGYGYQWELVGSKVINGNAQLEIIDQIKNGFWTYPDVIILTDNLNFNPATDCGIQANNLQTDFPFQYGLATCGLSQQMETAIFTTTMIGTECKYVDSTGGIITGSNQTPNIYDYNNDLEVNIYDLIIVAQYFATSNSNYDYNNDEVVNVLDLLIHISNWY